MDDRKSVTVETATRLIKSKLRRFVYSKLDEQEPGHYNAVLDHESVVETEANKDWRKVLQLWGETHDASVQGALDQCVQHALDTAVRDMKSVLRDSSFCLVEEYVKSFRFDPWQRTP